MKKRLIVVLSTLVIVTTSVSGQEALNEIIEPGAVLQKLAGGFSFTEGPSSDMNGNVFFTDQPNNRILEWSTDGQLTNFMQPCGRSNGLAFDSKGNIWACADEKNELILISPDKNITHIPSRFSGKLLNGPNDVWPDCRGGVYFTDPFYKRTWWDHTDQPQDIQAVYYLKPDHKTIVRVISDMLQPNGIVGTPGCNRLYVADIGDNITWSYKINKDGTLGDKRLFCKMGSDGMTIDSEGNVYLTGKGVTVFDKNGRERGNIPVPEDWTANVCFGGKDMKSLFITASKGLYMIRLRVKGYSQ
ncbi:MAG TPA: SMP-30/gluconolactonase/LRE family protein [Bacteroidales bacterium]|nr:SMP-30/gluconolactonase/LRE family protein [Bacteroidales bacterium]